MLYDNKNIKIIQILLFYRTPSAIASQWAQSGASRLFAFGEPHRWALPTKELSHSPSTSTFGNPVRSKRITEIFVHKYIFINSLKSLLVRYIANEPK